MSCAKSAKPIEVPLCCGLRWAQAIMYEIVARIPKRRGAFGAYWESGTCPAVDIFKVIRQRTLVAMWPYAAITVATY